MKKISPNLNELSQFFISLFKRKIEDNSHIYCIFKENIRKLSNCMKKKNQSCKPLKINKAHDEYLQ